MVDMVDLTGARGAPEGTGQTRSPANGKRYLDSLTVLFCISLVGLALHVLDDALVTREPDWYGIGVGEFLLYCALLYLIVPPLGLVFARRGRLFGLAIVALYAFQALYGAGLNHVRHLLGSFQGSQVLPTLLHALGVDYAPLLTHHGLLSVLLNMAGLGVTPPHTHTLLSDVVVFFNIGLNLGLLCLVLLAAREQWTRRGGPGPLEEEKLLEAKS
jgi:hypothetical protein